MTDTSQLSGSSIIPCLRYRNAPAAIDWLCDVFGMKRQLVVPMPDGSIVHAQLTFGNGMIMLGSASGGEMAKWSKQPDEVGGCETQSPYLVVPDADAVYVRVKAAGATIVRDIRDEDYGGRGFGCLDLEGHLWYVGTYNPWIN